MTVSEPASALGLAQGRVSSHVTCLRWCGHVQAEVDGRFNGYVLIDDRIREIVWLGESIVIANADRLTSCRVLASEGL
jgi:ArsR family transcriptional regulator, cadmium/lead-responsive transcriptional repressor